MLKVTKVLKGMKWSFAKNCYAKVSTAERYEIGKFSTLMSTL